jgi:tetratricopeptide (TPR) repeat protein
MTRSVRILAILLTATTPAAAAAMQVVPMTDLSYFEKPHPVIFPDADIKLCLIEFEAPSGNPTGHLLTLELHQAYGRRIGDLPGAAVVAWVAGSGLSISNFRLKADQDGADQKAQLAVWGRVLSDAQQPPQAAPRLSLLVPPPGISAKFVSSSARGVLDAPVAQGWVDFAPSGDMESLAAFLSGIAHYYKGATHSGAEARQWLTQSVAEFGDYLRRVPDTADSGAAAQAHLFSARALVRLGDLAGAARHASDAARLNPYDPAVPQAQAVISLLQDQPQAEVRAHVAEAVRLAPADPSARLDLALLDAAAGKGGEALKRINEAKQVQQLLHGEASPAQEKLERDIRQMR